MTINNQFVQNMLQTYDRQMDTGRRLNRLRKYLRKSSEKDSSEQTEAKRRKTIQKVASEIVENLLTSKSDTPLVQEIKSQMEKELGSPLIFYYPPNGEEMQILKGSPKEHAELSEKEKEKLMRTLWETTVKIVNRTML